MSNWKEHLEKIRGWIDGEKQDEFEEKIVKAHDNKSESELFLQKLLTSVEVLLKAEIVRIPNTNKTYIPERFLVFISTEADKNLRDDKRKFFEQSLNVLILERAKELAGKLELTSKKLLVEILVNAVLEDDEIEVKIGAENEEIKKRTIQFVINEEQFKPDKTLDLSSDDDKTFYQPNPNVKPDQSVNNQTIEDLGTVEDFDFAGILYRIEVWHEGKKINELPVIHKKITIGRDDADKVANLRLPTENRKISRTHAEINLGEDGEFWVTSLHKNPTIVDGKTIRNGEWAKVGQNGEVQIYDFTLKTRLTN